MTDRDSLRLRRVLSRGFSAAPLMLLVFLVGCADPLPERVPVSGIVMIDGAPVQHGIVMFVPENGRPSRGGIEQDGRFKLSCYQRHDGATLGVHRVSVTAREEFGEKTRWHAPKKYSKHKTSGLSVTIDGPTEDVVIELEWDGGKPFVEE